MKTTLESHGCRGNEAEIESCAIECKTGNKGNSIIAQSINAYWPHYSMQNHTEAQKGHAVVSSFFLQLYEETTNYLSFRHFFNFMTKRQKKCSFVIFSIL